jgi:hypothetical protein
MTRFLAPIFNPLFLIHWFQSVVFKKVIGMLAINLKWSRIRYACALTAILAIISGHSRSAFAVAPRIATVADQTAAIGTSYVFKPTLEQGGMVNWSKLYGPDDVRVDAVSGAVTWSIPPTLAAESFHIGVQAANADGVAREVWIVHAGVSNVLEVSPSATLKTLRAGFAALPSGGTLVIKAGTYIGTNNTFGANTGEKPRSGTASKLTTVMSEQPGSVILDGQGEVDPLVLSSDYKGTVDDKYYPSAAANYIALKGIEVHNSRSGGLAVMYAHHIKLIDMGAEDSGRKYLEENVMNVNINRSANILMEGLYTWGYGRYAINIYKSEQVISRRNMVRVDNFAGGDPIGGYQTYCSRHIRQQNNLVVDSDHPEFWTNNIDWASAFAVSATDCWDIPEDIQYVRSMAVNNALSVGDTAARQSKDAIVHQDIVGWDANLQRFSHGTSTAHYPMYNARGHMQITQSTLGNIRQADGPLLAGGQNFIYATDLPFVMSNSIFYQLGYKNGDVIDQGPLITCETSVCRFTDNIFYNFKGKIPSNSTLTPMTRNTTINPISQGLRYLPQLDPQSPLRTAGANSSRIGAEVMTYKGRSGTFWGETGFDDETNQPMWPIANEHVIGNAMRQWSFTGATRNNGPTSTLSGARGYAVNGETLSNYLWGYLGNLVPVFNLHAHGGNNTALLLWDLPAAKSLNLINGYRVYRLNNGQQTLVAEINDRNLFHTTIDGLDNSVSYQFAVTTFNGTQESGYAYPVEVIPTPKAKPMTPILNIKVN